MEVAGQTVAKEGTASPMIAHLTARARYLPIELTEHDVAAWLWERLRRAFPNAMAALLMPNHPHLLTLTDDIQASRQAFKNVISGLRRSHNPGAGILWEPIGLAEEIADQKKARRMSRYVALNPCRAGLVDDPLSWPWSTHRDVMGAIADPWIDADDLARALGWRGSPFTEGFHRYVSSAPSVSVTGTPAPRGTAPTFVADQPLEVLICAAASATRGTPRDITGQTLTRALFLRLAMEHGWDDTARLAAVCGISARSVQRHRAGRAVPGMAAAELCLADQRLRRWEVGLHSSRNATFAPRPPRGQPPFVASGDVWTPTSQP